MTVMQEQEIARYVERVRQALADLPPDVRDELVEDLPEHLAEVAAEGTGSLVDRLGPPEAYAAELRAAAGAGVRPAALNLDDRIGAVVVKVRARLRQIDTKTGPIIGYAKTSDFLRLLRPAWWVARGYLVALLLTVMMAEFNGGSTGLVPAFDGSTVAGLLLVAVAVIGSIWLGRRSAGFSRWPRLAVHAGSAVVILFGLFGLLNFSWQSHLRPDYEQVYDSNPYSHVRDVYVYDSQGRLLEGVRLFDQYGQPIRLGYPSCLDGREQASAGDPTRLPYPYCPQDAPFRFGPGPTVSAPDPAQPSPTATPAPPATPSATPTPIAPTTAPTSPSPTG